MCWSATIIVINESRQLDSGVCVGLLLGTQLGNPGLSVQEQRAVSKRVTAISQGSTIYVSCIRVIKDVIATTQL